jgi:hypothetical protein
MVALLSSLLTLVLIISLIVIPSSEWGCGYIAARVQTRFQILCQVKTRKWKVLCRSMHAIPNCSKSNVTEGLGTSRMVAVGTAITGSLPHRSQRAETAASYLRIHSCNSNPTVGNPHELVASAEYKVEMVCEKEKVQIVMHELLRIHPYEEPAYEIYKLCQSFERSG